MYWSTLMKKFLGMNNLYIKVLVIIFCIYFVSVLVNQQTKLNAYSESQAYYKEKTDEAIKSFSLEKSYSPRTIFQQYNEII